MPPVAQPLLSAAQKLAGRYRLEQRVGAAERGAAFDDRGIIVAGKCDDDSRHPVRAPERLDDVEAVAVGESEIDEHQVGWVGARAGDRVRDRGSDGHPPPRLLEEDAERAAHQLVVFDDEDVRGATLPTHPSLYG